MVTSITQYIDRVAAQYPDKIAYEDAKKSMSFLSLSEFAKRIGSCILQYTVPKSPIVIYMEKAADNIVAYMGVAYAGCFYVPIDSQMPLERINLILEKLSPSVIIYDEFTKKRIEELKCESEFLDFQFLCESQCDPDNLKQVQICSTDLLYVLFTSGSTGVPKGVTISHGAVIDFIEWICDVYGLDTRTKLCNQAPFYFDASVPDIYIPLKTGGTTFIPPKSYYILPKEILSYINSKEINTLIWVPSALCNVVNSHALETCVPKSLKLIMFCGEVMPCKYLNAWRKALPRVKYVNFYGPTEATYACMYYNIDREYRDDEVLPLGKACGNTRIYLLNEEGQLVKNDELGEICILGQGLSEGYYNDLQKTEEVFVQNPLNSTYCEKMYRTGDLAHVKKGEVIYVGRKDFQIKRLGHRIELGEIENIIMSMAFVECACCIYDDAINEIVAFYVGNLEEKVIKRRTRETLPKYMLPDKILRLQKMPMNLNGKIDRNFLKKEYIEMSGLEG